MIGCIITVLAAGVVAVDQSPATAAPSSTSKVTPKSTGGDNNVIEISVAGSPVTDITTRNLTLTPAFTPADTDYVWYCANGVNHVVLTISSSGTVTHGAESGTSVTVPVTVVNNQAVVVTAPGGSQYWIRCLPAKFPRFSVTIPGSPAPAYYETETFATKAVPGYPIILNSYGTPVWYLNGVPGSAQNTQVVPGTHTISWDQDPYYTLYNLDTDTASALTPAVTGFDEHELYFDPEGNSWMLSRPPVTGYNLSDIGFPAVSAIADCVVQEMNPQGQLIWQWNASQHVSPTETIHALVGEIVANGVETVDVYHCNSIDVDPINQDDVLISMRNVGVFLVDKTTGDIIWKLGGTAVAPMDGEPVLNITNDPETTISGQHDARFEPNGQISMFDDHTAAKNAGRGVEYAINTSTNTAMMVWEYVDPSHVSQQGMGSVRIYDSNQVTYDQAGSNYLGPDETIIDWGHGGQQAGFVVINNANQVLMNVAYSGGFRGYRAEMVPLSALSLSELRDSSGTVLTLPAVSRG